MPRGLVPLLDRDDESRTWPYAGSPCMGPTFYLEGTKYWSCSYTLTKEAVRRIGSNYTNRPDSWCTAFLTALLACQPQHLPFSIYTLHVLLQLESEVFILSKPTWRNNDVIGRTARPHIVLGLKPCSELHEGHFGPFKCTPVFVFST